MERELKVQETNIEEKVEGTQANGSGGGNRGGILGAIVETIGEIVQQTKELIIGQHKT